MTEAQKKARLAMIKKAVKNVNRTTKQVESHLTKQVKKAKHLSPSSLDAFHEKNMYMSEKETRDFLQGTEYISNYNAMKSHDEWN